MPKDKARSPRKRTRVIDALFTGWSQRDARLSIILLLEYVAGLVFSHEVSLSSQCYHTTDDGLQDVLNARESEFHGCLDGDRLMECEA